MCQAIGPELTLYDSINRPSEALVLPERYLRARMSVFARYSHSTAAVLDKVIYSSVRMMD